MQRVIFLSLLALAAGQSSLTLAAEGGVGNSAGSSAAQATGQETSGDIVISADDTTVLSTATVTATGTAPASASTPTPTPASTPTVSTPATATATAQAAATGSGVASAVATATTMPISMLPAAFAAPVPAPMVYYKKLEEAKPEPTCADMKDDMCPAMSEFVHCGYCILQKYPLVGYGCPIENTLVKKQGTKGEYEVVTKAMCDCPKGALVIEDPTYCPTCNLALMELAACSGYENIPKDISVIEIAASCIEQVMVPMKFLEECKFIKTDKKDPKKYTVVEPTPTVIVVDPVVKSVKPVPVVPVPVPVPVATVPVASATSSASAVASGIASATASATVN